MFIGRHASMELGNPNQEPGKHRIGQLEHGIYGLHLGRGDQCNPEYYLFERENGQTDNDPNVRRI